METLHGRLEREHRTLVCMSRIYCKDHHAGDPGAELCPDCHALMEYAGRRLAKCPYGTDKPTCAKCPIHCYKPEPREQTRDIMRYAGPLSVWVANFLTDSELNYRLLRGTAPWKYIGFFLGCSFAVSSIMALTIRSSRVRGMTKWALPL